MRPARPVTPVGLIAEHLARAIARLDVLGAPDDELAAAVRGAEQIARGLEPYVSDCSSPPSPALERVARRTAAHDWDGHDGPVALEQEMLSGQVEAAALRLIARLGGARSALEVGTFTGYSAIALAEALGPDGRVVACELDPVVAAIAAENFRTAAVGERIELRVGPALDTLAQLAHDGETFDLVFLDADKSGYADHLAAVLDGGLLARDGVLLADNTLLQGEPWRPGPPSANGAAIAHFNAVVAGDPRLEQVLLPLRDGLTLARWA